MARFSDQVAKLENGEAGSFSRPDGKNNERAEVEQRYGYFDQHVSGLVVSLTCEPFFDFFVKDAGPCYLSRGEVDDGRRHAFRVGVPAPATIAYEVG